MLGELCSAGQPRAGVPTQRKDLFLQVEKEKQDPGENDCCQQKTKKWTAIADRSDGRSTVKSGAGKRSGQGIAGFKRAGIFLTSREKTGQQLNSVAVWNNVLVAKISFPAEFCHFDIYISTKLLVLKLLDQLGRKVLFDKRDCLISEPLLDGLLRASFSAWLRGRIANRVVVERDDFFLEGNL